MMKRSIRPFIDAAVWVSSGRWGPRRVRDDECAILRAEDYYTALLKDDPVSLRRGARGSLTWTVFGRRFLAAYEVRPNAVWRSGRLFLACPKCAARVARLYVPSETAWLACRRCWGLTYGSRSLNHYGPDKWLPIPFAAVATLSRRERRAEAAEARYAERRLLRRASTGL